MKGKDIKRYTYLFYINFEKHLHSFTAALNKVVLIYNSLVNLESLKSIC